MKNIDYYGTELFLKSMEAGGCATDLVHEVKNKKPHYCSDHNRNCEQCIAEATQWLKEDFKRITEKEKDFLHLLNKKYKKIKLEEDNKIALLDDKNVIIAYVNLALFFDERAFKLAKIGEYLLIEELLKLEVA